MPGTGVEVKVGAIVGVGERMGEAVGVGAALWVAATIVAISSGAVLGISAGAQAAVTPSSAKIRKDSRGRCRLGAITGSSKYTAAVMMGGAGAV